MKKFLQDEEGHNSLMRLVIFASLLLAIPLIINGIVLTYFQNPQAQMLIGSGVTLLSVSEIAKAFQKKFEK